MAGIYSHFWDDHMHVSTYLKIGYYLLYLEFAIFVLVSMFYFEYPPTLPYLGAILCLLFVARVWHTRDDVHKCTLTDIKEQECA